MFKYLVLQFISKKIRKIYTSHILNTYQIFPGDPPLQLHGESVSGGEVPRGAQVRDRVDRGVPRRVGGHPAVGGRPGLHTAVPQAAPVWAADDKAMCYQ